MICPPRALLAAQHFAQALKITQLFADSEPAFKESSVVKILVPLKRVADPDNANKVKVNNGKLETTGLEWKPNPFDQYAVETALRLTENGANTKARQGEVVVVTFGGADTGETLRAALAMGADRAIRVDASDDALDGDIVARALKALVDKEKPDLVLAGKQAVDGDSNQVAQLLAEYLGWPQATFAGTIKSEGDKAMIVGREVDGGTIKLKVELPAVVSVDLRIVAPTSVRSIHTAESHKYADGVRFAPLMAIIAAKKKPMAEMKLADLVDGAALKVKYGTFELPPARKAGIKVKTVTELVDKLKNEAKAL
jgi:electron transfer flavoprotein beta subunit